ncbi:MAG: hypothetical protein II110_10590, partial [Treponema sp.]|nr:hypothetical protein [Treponema sp.]
MLKLLACKCVQHDGVRRGEVFLLTQRIPSPRQSQGTVFKAALRQAQGPPFDRLRDHPSTGSG